MTKGHWFSYLLSYVLCAWFLWCAHGKALDDQMFYFMMIVIVVVRAEAKRVSVELGGRE